MISVNGTCQAITANIITMNKNDLLMLASFGKIGPRGFAKLVENDTQNEVDFSHIPARDMIKAGIKSEITHEFVQFREQFDVDHALSELDKYGVRLVSQDDADYPLLLKEISDAPYLLFVKGSLGPLQRSSLAVVGSRKHTHYGSQIIDKVVVPLAERGITIVSGLALGIDGLAHQAALQAKSATVAIIGCGLDRIYPSEHASLARRIIEEGGAIISEYPLGTPPLKQYFPARNRIIAGVSQGTLVVECDVKSGAMITAHHALQENREVYAVPGPITSQSSAGPNALLRMGAHVITSTDELLSYYGVKEVKGKSKLATPLFSGTLPPHERLVFDILTNEPTHVDGLQEQLEISMQELNSALLFLEMKGLVQNVGAAQYIKR